MSNFKAIYFDLDDTLLDRSKAVDKIFIIILEKCYGDINDEMKSKMLSSFKEYDKKNYGENDKRNVLESLFNEFPPKYRLPSNSIQEFWNKYFPQCFTVNQNIIDVINVIKKKAKVGIITNGSTKRQKAKIINAHLNNCFEEIFISEEVGFSKPDKRIFELALKQLNMVPEDVLFVGDDIEKDIGGCQKANMIGVWFNPQMIENKTEIKPDFEIDSLDELLNLLK